MDSQARGPPVPWQSAWLQPNAHTRPCQLPAWCWKGRSPSKGQPACLLGASCLELGSPQGPPLCQGSMKGDASQCGLDLEGRPHAEVAPHGIFQRPLVSLGFLGHFLRTSVIAGSSCEVSTAPPLPDPWAPREALVLATTVSSIYQPRHHTSRLSGLPFLSPPDRLLAVSERLQPRLGSDKK